jgi:hypothetical protein
MPYKVPKIPIFPELLGTEKRVQQLQQKIAELDWLEYSFGLAKRVTLEVNEDVEFAPVVYVGTRADSLDMRPWPSDVYKSYAFWDLVETAEFDYGENTTGRRQYPQVIQTVALIVVLDNKKISQEQDYNITHSICKNELIEKLNFANIYKGNSNITNMIENKPLDVFEGYDVADELMEPRSMIRIEMELNYLQDCTNGS